MLTLLFGDQAVGRVEMENAYDALPREPQQSFAKVEVRAKPGMELGAEAFTALDYLVGAMDERGPMAKHVDLALHWHEQGCSADSPLDRFVAFFIGIETLCKGQSKAAGGVQVAKERVAKYGPGLKKAIPKSFGQQVIDSLVNSLGRASLREEFDAYAAARRLPADLAASFSRLSRLRNDIVHGDAAEPEADDVRDARQLLTTMLKAEFGIAFSVPWERDPGLAEIFLPWTYVNYGWMPKRPEAPPASPG